MTHLRNLIYSLNFRVGIIMFDTVLIVLAIVGFTYVNQFSEQVDRRIGTQVQIPGQLMRSGLLPYSSVEDSEMIRELIGEDICRALVVGINKRVYFSSNSEDLGQDVSSISGLNPALFDIDNPSNVTTFEEHHVINISPIYDSNNENLRMFLYLEVETDEAQAEKAAMIRLFAYGSGITLLITALVINLTFRFAVAKRIHQVLTVLTEVESGDLTARAPGGASKDELGTLHRGVNSMIEELEVHVNNLESRVYERTLDLERSNEQLEQFAYVASHDLQEPLRSISGYIQLLERKYQGQLDDKADHYIERTLAASDRMKALIQGLLSFSRVGTNSQPFALTPLQDVLDIAVDNLHGVIEETKTVIHSPELPQVFADKNQLVQLFQNMIGNAIKFRGDEKSEISISYSQSNGKYKISVHDNGIGIEPEFRDRIFQIFQRLHSRSEYQGTGIGLAICKKIVERHGGEIWVESNGGKGSVFNFTIPVTGEIT